MTTAHEVEPVLPESGQTPGATEAPGGEVSRRRLIQGAAVAGTVVAAGVTLAACGAGGSAGGTGSGGSGSGGGTTGGAIATTSQIPVGEGVIFKDQHVVITQPVAGTFKAFSSTCTHMGCTVFQVTNGLIQCPCHGSEYSVVDGSVKRGPAPKALPPKQITVKGNQITLDS
jgi:Rieske Fe-S protein